MPQSGWHQDEVWAAIFGVEVPYFREQVDNLGISRAKVGNRTFVRAERIAAYLDSIEETKSDAKKKKASKRRRNDLPP